MNDAPRTALVTGAARRLGRAMAVALARDGFDIALHYRNSEDDAREAADEIRAIGRQAHLIQADLENEADTRRVVPLATAALGPIGLLINNASLFEDDDLTTADRAGWDRHMEANLRAPFVLTQDFAAALPQGRGALVVNMIDQRVLKPTPQFITYSLSKAGLWWLTRTAAQALGPKGVRVNAIAPGPTLQNSRQTEADFAAQGTSTILGRPSSPEEIVKALRYLIDAHAVTGQMIAVDAGQHLIWRTPDVSVTE